MTTARPWKKRCAACGTPEDLPEEEWVNGKPPEFRMAKTPTGTWCLCDQCPDEPED